MDLIVLGFGCIALGTDFGYGYGSRIERLHCNESDRGDHSLSPEHQCYGVHGRSTVADNVQKFWLVSRLVSHGNTAGDMLFEIRPSW